MSKRDDVKDLYKKSENASRLAFFLFGSNIILACIAFVASSSWVDAITTVEILISILFAATEIADEVWFFYDAQHERRKSFLSNSLGTNLSDFKTEDYYNNSYDPSVIRMGINCYENVFFSKNIAAKRALWEFVKTVICVLIFILSCLIVKDKNVLFMISQVIFSGIFISNTIRSLAFFVRVKQLYERFRNEFLVSGIKNDKQLISIIDCVMEYECLKTSFHIMLSSKVFEKNNPEWTIKWSQIEEAIEVDKKVEKVAFLHL